MYTKMKMASFEKSDWNQTWFMDINNMGPLYVHVIKGQKSRSKVI